MVDSSSRIIGVYTGVPGGTRERSYSHKGWIMKGIHSEKDRNSQN